MLDGMRVGVRVIGVLVHRSTHLGLVLAKECIDILDGMSVGVRVIGVLVHWKIRKQRFDKMKL